MTPAAQEGPKSIPAALGLAALSLASSERDKRHNFAVQHFAPQSFDDEIPFKFNGMFQFFKKIFESSDAVC